jgi:hypothetical protein
MLVPDHGLPQNFIKLQQNKYSVHEDCQGKLDSLSPVRFIPSERSLLSALYGNPALVKGGKRTGTICNSRQCADLPIRPNLSMSKAAMPFLKANSAFYAPLLFSTSGASKDAQQFLRLMTASQPC